MRISKFWLGKITLDFISLFKVVQRGEGLGLGHVSVSKQGRELNCEYRSRDWDIVSLVSKALCRGRMMKTELHLIGKQLS